MANFIGMVFATLQKEGVNTKGMSTDEAVKKFNELKGKNGGGKEGGDKKAQSQDKKELTPNESKRLQELGVEERPTQNSSFKKNTNFLDNQDIDWELAEKNEKLNGSKAKNPNRHDKYGNELLSDEAFKVGLEAGQSYVDYMTKYDDISKLRQSNVFLGHLSDIIGNAITNNGFNPNQDTTYQDYNEIIGNILGDEVNIETYEARKGTGYVGRKYQGYKPK